MFRDLETEEAQIVNSITYSNALRFYPCNVKFKSKVTGELYMFHLSTLHRVAV
jgi:gamma-glutamylcyclotransferase (GGCT)/AIG2-like uncharacterized protein YtfP